MPDAAERLGTLGTPLIAPPKVEVFELTAGGVAEKRDDWTDQALQHVTNALTAQTGFKPHIAGTEPNDAVREELQEVVAMLQTITVNHVGNLIGPKQLSSANRPLSYNVGRIDTLADALGSEVLLVVFARDEFSTGGRKALMALGVLTAAVTGVYVVPAGGATLNSAALVQRDGTVLWFNYAQGGGDVRTPEGADQSMKALLAGMPTSSRNY